MSEFGAPATLSTPLGSIDFNTRDDQEYFITNITGLDGESLRTPEDDAPGTDGGIVHDFWATARHITIEGHFLMDPALSFYQQIVQRNAMMDDLRKKCRSIKRADGTWSWTPSGGSTFNLTVRCDLQPLYTGEGVLKTFVFGLVAEDPDYD